VGKLKYTIFKAKTERKEIEQMLNKIEKEKENDK
jgi:hypothetical protein